MKKLLSLVTVFALLFVACEGPQGPPGLNGLNGFDGLDGQPASAFEIVLDFNAPNYEVVESYGFNVSSSTSTLVYILWETLSDGTEIWRQLPQTVIFNNGDDLVYNFDFTQLDVRFFLEGSNLNALGPEWTQAQTFRVVVVPTINVGRVDVSDYNAVVNYFGITEFEKRN